MKQKRIAECKYNSLAPYSGKEANGKIEYGKNLMKHRKIYLAVSIGCLLMAAIYYQIESPNCKMKLATSGKKFPTKKHLKDAML